MKKILVMIATDFSEGGVSTYLLNTLSYCDRTNCKFDFITPGRIVAKEKAKKMRLICDGMFSLELKIPDIHASIFQKLKYLFSLTYYISKMLKVRKYDVIYINTGDILHQAILLILSRIYSIPRRIAHSHSRRSNSSALKESLRYVFQKIIVNNATDLIACTREAAISLFGKSAGEKTVILKNGIETQKYVFRKEMRQQYRAKLGIKSDEFLIGHIGRFAEVKNHKFLIEIFQKVSEKCSSAKLLLIGEGKLEEAVHRQVINMHLEERVIFAGATCETENYYCAMDVFVLPSLNEGLGIVNIEAQVSGLRVLCSDAVPQEARITDLVEYMSLSESSEKWAQKILSYKNGYQRETRLEEIIKAGYDISETAKQLEELILIDKNI